MNSKFSVKMKHKSTGMTLIEVLIASVILFAAIGTISGIHRVLNHYQRQNLADYALLLNQQSFFDYLSYSLGQKIVSGTYNINEYQLVWQAKLKDRAPVISQFDPDGLAESAFSERGHITLYQITYHLNKYPEKSFEITLFTTEDIQASTGF
ncbi:prepilin-type N-terminal cleavage/methylation domain-containing protein [Colwellia sp. E2M01]|uniref:type IV pilus modification PilV family protein n=1 Tax=Colwellia sp. E2M01 TaxID=2841561 RepID=UPI001C085740|nr:prepilin-type N-terminal cleavage/methylation domain-containing protein [Colwellia sp. E2M01]MBU2869356.1 prepilin-type N-terminal cleavage/methylation domain-containing protein [Colwellia sp. E2M01]